MLDGLGVRHVRLLSLGRQDDSEIRLRSGLWRNGGRRGNPGSLRDHLRRRIHPSI